MKNLLIFVLLLVVAGLLLARFKPEWVPFLIGTPLARDARVEVELALPKTSEVKADPAPPMYRWTDDQGVIQVSDRPPQGRAYETLRYDPNTNVIPAPRPQPQADER
jgi:hypothetical protein